MSLITRRRAEVDAKLGSLDNEFVHWKEVTTRPGMGRHNSQVRRLAATIDGVLDPLRKTLKELAKDSPDVLLNGESWENEILAAHAIWEVFRSKLVLREDSLFVKKLAACDDLAWECYSPALNRWAPERKGPPLVYFSATWSPFAMSRDRNFQNEIRAPRGTAAALGEKDFQAVLQQLPIPLVSIPWYQVFHMPGALIIAHEIGHVVEFDFDLTGEIAAALDGADLEFKDAWKGWASEMFADVYGCCAMGPAFAGAMIDLNATAVRPVQTEDRTYGIYPIRNLRVRLMTETLRQTGHAAAADQLLDGWKAVYGEMTTMPKLLAELPKVVSALLAGPYRGDALTKIIQFPSEWCAKIPAIGQRASQGQTLAGYTVPRQLFAAAQWLHENPKWAGAERYENLIEQIIVKSSNATRFRAIIPTRNREEEEAREEADRDLIRMEEDDRKRGAELRKLLLRTAPAEDPPPAGAPPDRPGS